ncbi:MAG: hypothetical protein COB02_01690 [Candidatus Cloacimonadota bacterium]|nr:MAG: hypothetical protein COB02_01690 [Candidatus Cloacimonadota bacterium]
MNRKILIVDDSKAIHDDFKKIFTPNKNIEFENLGSFLFEDQKVKPTIDTEFQLENAFQGQEAHQMVLDSIKNNAPYAMAFVDMRMPPGWNGIETIQHLWKADPNLEIVICSAHSDYSWRDIMDRLGGTDQLLILKKPFDNIEVRQLAFSLTQKWNLKKQANLKLEDLEELVQQRTLELKKANDARLDFFESMSHEIRTPISGILGMLELISNSDLNRGQLESINLAKWSAKSLHALINDVLDYSKIKSNNLNLEKIEFSLNSTLEEISQMYSIMADEKGLVLYCKQDFSLPNSLFGDPTRLRQIIINLIGNALKFTKSGYLYIKSEEISRNSKIVKFRISVQDTGIGVKKDKLETIFSKFKQASEDTTRNFGGTGLGLSISKDLIELMGGKIGIESKLGKGSTFYLNLELPFISYEKDKALSVEDKIYLLIQDNLQRDIIEYYLKQFNIGFKILLSLEEINKCKISDIILTDYLTVDNYLNDYHNIYQLVNISNPTLLEEQNQSVKYLTLPIKKRDFIEVLSSSIFLKKEIDALKDESFEHNILIVEDSLVNQKIISFMLKKLPCKFDICSDGESAIDQLKQKNDYDLIFMDCHLPGLNGYETSKIIRNQKLVFDDVAIIAMTADMNLDDKENCIASGMNDIVIKPFDIKRIQFVINKFTLNNFVKNQGSLIKERKIFFVIDADVKSFEVKKISIIEVFETAEVKQIKTTLEACSALKNHQPDYLILDLDVELVSGIELLSLVFSNEALKQVKVILFTDLSEDDDLIIEAKDIEGLYFCSKSSNFQEYLSSIR